jgi:hypothetical protein
MRLIDVFWISELVYLALCGVIYAKKLLKSSNFTFFDFYVFTLSLFAIFDIDIFFSVDFVFFRDYCWNKLLPNKL